MQQLAKILALQLQISPSNDYSGLISFRIDWLDLLAVPRDSQESSPTPQFKSINSSALSLLRGTLVGKVMPLLLNMLSRLVITFLPRSKGLLISWLQSPFAVILEPPQINSDTVSTVSPSISHVAMRPDAMIFVF